MKQGMKHKKLLKSIAGLSAVFALVAGTEWNGYNMFDRKQGQNILCTLDPTCRHLTAGEIELARPVFGEAIDYRNVKLFSRNYLYFLNNDEAMTPNGNLYLPSKPLWLEDFSAGSTSDKQLFMHELTHVWQYQTGKGVVTGALDNYMSYDFDYASSYNYKLKQYPLFPDFNIEQQADIISDYTGLRIELWNLLDAGSDAADYIQRNCPDIRAFEDKIGQVLPLQREAACPVPQPLKVAKRPHRKPRHP